MGLAPPVQLCTYRCKRVESDLSDTKDEDFVNETHDESISELIHCVQNEAKMTWHIVYKNARIYSWMFQEA